MTCAHCGAPLPPVALFCGRCGRSVESSAPPAEPPGVGRSDRHATRAACVTCGSVPQIGDRYCGECGTGLEVERYDPPGAPEVERHDPPAAMIASASPLSVSPLSVSPLSVSAPTPVVAPSPSPASASAPSPGDEPAPIVDIPAPPEQVVLQFSTGDSVSVVGSGLLGRNPRPEPGEVVDHIVVISDPTRSVSKTHLAFGRDGEAFWVSDRHSGNGTVLREPGQLPRFCEPGRRYHVARGTRVDMGDQFMIIA